MMKAPSLEEISAAFPQWEILELVGSGGMGFVYKARQPGLDRLVALKILSPELGRDPEFAERFAREARALGRLRHPNVVTLHEHGEVGGFFYLVMEYVDGVNLRQAMQAGRFTPEQALAIVPSICDALQAAHAQGIWHRDIKPENILLDRDGRVKIADFGIARLTGEAVSHFTLTLTSGRLGSAAYMAPEQYEKPHDVDHRADIYSLGVVIYEMLTGELPLGRFPPPSQRAEVSARIDEIVLRTLEKERELRQQSADEVKTEVRDAAAAKGPQGKVPRPPTVNPAWVAASLGLLLCGGIVAGAAALVAGFYQNALVDGMMMVLVVLGGAAAALGYLGSLRALHAANLGRLPSGTRSALMILVFWPTVAALAYLGALCWFAWFKRGLEPLAASGAGGLGYAVLALIAPLLVAKALWNGLRCDGDKPASRRPNFGGIAVAAILAVTAIVLVRYVSYREVQYRSYRSIFIQLHKEIREPEDLPLIREALDRAMGESRTDFRATLLGSEDPANPLALGTPVAILECTARDAEKTELRFDAVAERLKASLPKRIGVNKGAGGVTNFFPDKHVPDAIQEGYRTVRALNLFLLTMPVMVVLLGAPARGALSLIPELAGILTAAALWNSPWPRVPAGFPPPLRANVALAPLPEPEYDFTTLRHAVESLAKAAGKRDVDAFKRGVSESLLENLLKKDPGLTTLMKHWEPLVYSHQISQTGDRARVQVKDKITGAPAEMSLVRENWEWKHEY